MLICGRFEGVDQRVLDYYKIKELSIGDYVLCGGELAAMVVIESCIRLLPGVVGNSKSLQSESFASGYYLEYDQYTKPAVWNGILVPDVLRSGHHKNIERWKASSSALNTKKRQKC